MPMLSITTSLGDWGSGVQISPLRPIISGSCSQISFRKIIGAERERTHWAHTHFGSATAT